jgi:acyl-CoA dehydrogenase
MIKIVAPQITGKVFDWAIQAFGGGGVADIWLARTCAFQRCLRIADGPDEVHRDQLGRMEFKAQMNTDPQRNGSWSHVMIPDGLSRPGVSP